MHVTIKQQATEKCINSFFDQQTPQNMISDLRSMMQKVILSSVVTETDPHYLCEMMFTTDNITNLIIQMAIINDFDLLKE